MTYTYTYTSTFTRLGLIEVNLRAALRRAANIEGDMLDRLMDAVRKQWLSSFSVYATDRSGLCRAELRLTIEWDEYGMHIAAGRAHVAIDKRWRDNTAIEVDEAVREFERVVKVQALAVRWVVWYSPQVNRDGVLLEQVRQTVGLVSAPAPTWASTPQGIVLSPQELSELRVGLYLVR